MELCFAEQFIHHVSWTGNCEILQSAYRSSHSTEITLLKLKCDLLHSMDDKRVTCLALLDLSVAFDTVDHCILLEYLHDRIRFCGNVLKWTKKYLAGRQQKLLSK